MHPMPTNTQLQKRDTGQTGRIEYKSCSEQILVCERLSHCQRSSKVANIQSHHGPTSRCFESWQKHISNRSKFNMQLVGCRKQSSRKHKTKQKTKHANTGDCCARPKSAVSHPHVTIHDLLMSAGQVKRQVKLLLFHATSQISHASYADQHAAAKKGH